MAEPAETYTHGHAESVLRSHRWRTVDNSAAYVAARLVPGTDVLDVGCGPGTITIDIARRVAPGRVRAEVDRVREVTHVIPPRVSGGRTTILTRQAPADAPRFAPAQGCSTTG